jgi:hypothetical protein
MALLAERAAKSVIRLPWNSFGTAMLVENLRSWLTKILKKSQKSAILKTTNRLFERVSDFIQNYALRKDLSAAKQRVS